MSIPSNAECLNVAGLATNVRPSTFTNDIRTWITYPFGCQMIWIQQENSSEASPVCMSRFPDAFSILQNWTHTMEQINQTPRIVHTMLCERTSPEWCNVAEFGSIQCQLDATANHCIAIHPQCETLATYNSCTRWTPECVWSKTSFNSSHYSCVDRTCYNYNYDWYGCIAAGCTINDPSQYGPCVPLICANTVDFYWLYSDTIPPLSQLDITTKLQLDTWQKQVPTTHSLCDGFTMQTGQCSDWRTKIQCTPSPTSFSQQQMCVWDSTNAVCVSSDITSCLLYSDRSACTQAQMLTHLVTPINECWLTVDAHAPLCVPAIGGHCSWYSGDAIKCRSNRCLWNAKEQSCITSDAEIDAVMPEIEVDTLSITTAQMFTTTVTIPLEFVVDSRTWERFIIVVNDWSVDWTSTSIDVQNWLATYTTNYPECISAHNDEWAIDAHQNDVNIVPGTWQIYAANNTTSADNMNQIVNLSAMSDYWIDTSADAWAVSFFGFMRRNRGLVSGLVFELDDNQNPVMKMSISWSTNHCGKIDENGQKLLQISILRRLPIANAWFPGSSVYLSRSQQYTSDLLSMVSISSTNVPSLPMVIVSTNVARLVPCDSQYPVVMAKLDLQYSIQIRGGPVGTRVGVTSTNDIWFVDPMMTMTMNNCYNDVVTSIGATTCIGASNLCATIVTVQSECRNITTLGLRTFDTCNSQSHLNTHHDMWLFIKMCTGSMSTPHCTILNLNVPIKVSVTVQLNGDLNDLIQLQPFESVLYAFVFPKSQVSLSALQNVFPNNGSSSNTIIEFLSFLPTQSRLNIQDWTPLQPRMYLLLLVTAPQNSWWSSQGVEIMTPTPLQKSPTQFSWWSEVSLYDRGRILSNSSYVDVVVRNQRAQFTTVILFHDLVDRGIVKWVPRQYCNQVGCSQLQVTLNTCRSPPYACDALLLDLDHLATDPNVFWADQLMIISYTTVPNSPTDRSQSSAWTSMTSVQTFAIPTRPAQAALYNQFNVSLLFDPILNGLTPSMITPTALSCDMYASDPILMSICSKLTERAVWQPFENHHDYWTYRLITTLWMWVPLVLGYFMMSVTDEYTLHMKILYIRIICATALIIFVLTYHMRNAQLVFIQMHLALSMDVAIGWMLVLIAMIELKQDDRQMTMWKKTTTRIVHAFLWMCLSSMIGWRVIDGSYQYTLVMSWIGIVIILIGSNVWLVLPNTRTLTYQILAGGCAFFTYFDDTNDMRFFDHESSSIPWIIGACILCIMTTFIIWLTTTVGFVYQKARSLA